MNTIKKILSVAICMNCLFFGATAKKNVNAKTENIVAQMNYCMTAMTNIINDQSMATLQHESDQILNNLTMEGIAGLDDINDFRSALIDALENFKITAEERQLTKRIQSIRRDNLKWQALSNALSPAMVMTSNPYSGAFNVLITAARSVIEYNVARGEQSIEELQEMWTLRKEDMHVIARLRYDAQNILYKLFTKYHLKEGSRLTEATSKEFYGCYTDSNKERRLRRLLDNHEKFVDIAEYYYQLGMAYLDNNNYAMAKVNFGMYQQLYGQAPIFRYDEMSGCIALAKLANEPSLSNQQKESLIGVALKNLPHNSASLLQCALVYIQMNEMEKGCRLLRAGIDDPDATDKSILLMAATNLLSQMKKYPNAYNDIAQAISQLSMIDARSYLSYIVNTNNYAWSAGRLCSIISFDDIEESLTLNISINTITGWFGYEKDEYKINEEIQIILPSFLTFNQGDFHVFIENHNEDRVEIKELIVKYKDAISLEKVNKVDCFKANPGLKYLFLNPLDKNEQFFEVKPKLDYNKIKNGKWQGMSNYTLSNDDFDDIADFCEDNYKEHNNLILQCDEMDVDEKNIGVINGAEVTFVGENEYKPHHNDNMGGYYLRIIFDNGICLMYKFGYDKGFLKDSEYLNPYFYHTQENNRYVFRSETYLIEYMKGIPYYREDAIETKQADNEHKVLNKERMDSLTKWIMEYALGS